MLKAKITKAVGNVWKHQVRLWVNLALGKHVDLCILVASFVLRRMRKMWRENEREREIDGTLSLFSQSNRFVYLETQRVLPESSFPEYRLLGFLFSYMRLVVLHRVLVSFLLTCLYFFREVEVDQGLMAQIREELNCVILIYLNVQCFMRKKWGQRDIDTSDRCC